MSLNAKAVAKMLILNGTWDRFTREQDNPPFPWMIKLDGIASPSGRQELVDAFKELLPSSTPRIFEENRHQMWIILADGFEVKAVRQDLSEQRDAEGFFSGKCARLRAREARRR